MLPYLIKIIFQLILKFKQNIMKTYLKSMFAIMIASFVLIVGCKDDDPMNPTDELIASFQYEVSASNWAEVTFSNFSTNATSYDWDFGDDNSSTEENPTHTYAAGGEYVVTLTATGSDGETATKTETLNIVDPDEALTFLAGTAGKTWYLNRETIACGVGPTVGDVGWWAFGINTPLGDRPCVLDDAYTFNPDGSFDFNSNGTLFVDGEANGGWLGATEGCYDESEPGTLTGPNGEDLSAFGNGGSYNFNFDATANTITIDGLGAYVGLPVKTESGDSYIPVSTKTYQIFHSATGDIADTLSIAINALDNTFAWNFFLVSYHNPADLPVIPSAMPGANFTSMKDGNTVTFTNLSTNSTSYMWDFGDGNTSTDENPVHTYGGDGDYTVTLTAMDDGGLSDTASEIISISSAVFTGAEISSATGKVWTLDGEGSYIVGSCAGCNDFWTGLDANGVIERACQIDDQFIFFDDGTFEFASQGQVWAEDFMGGAFACTNDGDLVAPFDVFGSNTHSFTATETEITVNGAGAYLGFNKAYNGGEYPADGTGTPVSSITYTVIDYSNNNGVERISVTVDYSVGEAGTSFWTMNLISQ